MFDVVNIFAPNWERQDSYGRIALELADALLLNQGVVINAIGPNSSQRTLFPSFGGILLGYPTNFRKFGPMAVRGPRVALTMFESTVIPPGWEEVLNTCQAVIVPTAWVADVFRANGIESPIHVVPLGISPAFQLAERVPTAGRPYKFLVIADRGIRKGWHWAGYAFVRAFGEREDVHLTFKCREAALPFTFTNPNITLIAKDYSDEDMAQLYAEHDCMVFPAAGEGFGWPPREFAATGGTALVTNYSGMADGLSQWGIPFDHYHLVDAWRNDPDLGGLGQWAEVDVDPLADQMRAMQEQHLPTPEYSQRVAQYIHEAYRWDRFSEQVFAIWQDAKETWNVRHSHRKNAVFA